MSIYNWITIAIVLLGWAATYGKLCQKINQMEKRQDQVDADLKALRDHKGIDTKSPSRSLIAKRISSIKKC